MKSRLLELAGLILIGDGLMGLLHPRRHSLLWHVGPQLAKAVTEELAEHPNTARSIYAAELAVLRDDQRANAGHVRARHRSACGERVVRTRQGRAIRGPGPDNQAEMWRRSVEIASWSGHIDLTRAVIAVAGLHVEIIGGR